MHRFNRVKACINNTDGFAVVEATFVFPIMFMIFFALVLLAFYLPQRAMLQRATQYAATMIATEMSDTWLYYDTDNQALRRHTDHDALRDGKGGVYVALFRSVFGGGGDAAEGIVQQMDAAENMPVIATADLSVEYEIVNYVVYKEVVVTATRSIAVPINLSFIQFPGDIELVVTSKAVVQNADEFIRNIDLAVDFVDWVRETFPGVDNVFNAIGTVGTKIGGFFGI